MGFPHVNEIAHKYKDKVVVIAINVREAAHEESVTAEALQKRVAAFVQSMGDKFDFKVCMDAPDQSIFSSWMKASGMQGIPAAIIVDQQGKIAWIGHPGPTIDKSIDQLLAETYDYKAAAAAFQDDAPVLKQQEERRKVLDAIKPAEAALAAKDYNLALERVKEFVSAYPGEKKLALTCRAVALAHLDPQRALATAQAATREDQGSYAVCFINEDGLSRPVYEFARSILERDGNYEGSPWLDSLARCHFRLGNVQKAIETQKKLLEYVKAKNFPDSYIAGLEKTLRLYQQGK